MGWDQWSAAQDHPFGQSSNVPYEKSDISNYAPTPKSILLQDTSPSLLGTLSADHELFVAESQFPQGVSTPTDSTNITLGYIAQTSLRQHKIKSANRFTPVEKLIMNCSPIRSNRLRSQEDRLDSSPESGCVSMASSSPPLRRLFATTSPNLFNSTPIPQGGCGRAGRPMNYTPGTIESQNTQILFDNTPPNVTTTNDHHGKQSCKDLNDTRYSGHPLVFLPASFEQLDIGNVVSDGCGSSPPAGQKTVAVETTANKRLPPSSPPSTNQKVKRKRVSFVDQVQADDCQSSPNTASVLSSLDHGRLQRKRLDRHKLKVVTTPLTKFDIPVSLITKTTPSAGSVRRCKPLPMDAHKAPSNEPVDLTSVVWAKWKPDRLHYLVPADLLDQSGSSTRSVWRAKLHLSRNNSIVSLNKGEFIQVDPQSSIGVICKLAKKPDVAVEIIRWQSSRIVAIKNLQTGESSIIPSRHLFIDNLKLLRPSQLIQSHPPALLFAGMSFLVTCGEHKEDRMKRASIVAIIRKHGGRLLDKVAVHSSTQQLILLATEPKRTFKYLMAVVMGIPRVTLQWLLDCIEANAHLDLASPCYQVDNHVGGLQNKHPLKGQVWRIAGLNERMQREFGTILRALGADISDKHLHHYELLPAKSALCSVELLVDCILSGNFCMFP